MLRLYKTLISLTILLPLTLSRPNPLISQLLDRAAGINGDDGSNEGVSCSADDSTATIANFTLYPAWHRSMFDCLYRLDADNWDGTECVPTTTDGTNTPLGPSFGFYKSHSLLFGSGQDCFNHCRDCLAEGIDVQLAVTTHCDYTVNVAGPGIQAHCGMGFDYGT